jgi:hypothetical protein
MGTKILNEKNTSEEEIITTEKLTLTSIRDAACSWEEFGPPPYHCTY